MPLAQDLPRGGDIQREAKERYDEQNRGEGGEVGGLLDIERNQDNQHRNGDGDGQKEVEHPAWQRDDDDGDNADDEYNDREVFGFANALQKGQCALHEALVFCLFNLCQKFPSPKF